jgi:beta-propeller uncharacterized protein DUF5122
MKFRLGFLILLFLLVLFPVSVLASTWAKTYGGPDDLSWATSIQQTSDGGFIVGSKGCYYAPIYYSDYDFKVLKLNANGNVIWQKTYGGSGDDLINSIQQTSDGGFIVVGSTSSFSGSGGIWVLKLNANGNVIWQKTYGGSDSDGANSIQETSDGGFIVVGSTISFSGISGYWVLKLDANGNIAWQRAYGNSSQFATSIQQTSDGGFIVAGFTYPTPLKFCVLKLDGNGNVIWQKTYGGSKISEATSIQETSDGGFIVAGYTNSYGAGNSDIWVLKLNVNGNVTWQKTYGGTGGDGASSIQQTTDGGFILAGSTSSFGSGGIWVLKLDANGNVTWQKTYGGSGVDRARSIQQTSDGGFIVAGDTSSYGASDWDIWVLKLDANGNIPGCDLIQDTSVVPGNTSVIPTNTEVMPELTAATVSNSSVVPINTAASVEEQCFYAGDLSCAPVTPCRIVDTRLAGGAIPAGGIRSYNVWGDVASQGGNSAGCPSPNGEPYTVHINVTAVPVAGAGNLVAYPYGSTAPNASLVNYLSSAQNVANSGTIKTCFNCDKDINIKSNNGTTHVVIDVLGYDFEKP